MLQCNLFVLKMCFWEVCITFLLVTSASIHPIYFFLLIIVVLCQKCNNYMYLSMLLDTYKKGLSPSRAMHCLLKSPNLVVMMGVLGFGFIISPIKLFTKPIQCATFKAQVFPRSVGFLKTRIKILRLNEEMQWLWFTNWVLSMQRNGMDP